MAESELIENQNEMTSVTGGVPGSEGNAAVLRVKLVGPLGQKVRETVAELKNRGVSISAEEILAEHMERIPPRYFESQLLKYTPDRFYIETAIGTPEIRERLIRQAIRRLGKTSESSTVKSGKRREPKAKASPDAALASGG